MSTYKRQLGVLMWKNWLLKRRRWGSTLIEILFPILVMLLVNFFRVWTTTTSYDADLHLKDGAQLVMGDQYQILVGSLNYSQSKLAFIPKGDAALAASAYLNATYPPIGNYLTYFNTEDDLVSYFDLPDYGEASSPSIYIAVVLTNWTPPNYEYSIRTGQAVPDTFSYDQSGYTSSSWQNYATSGFLALQATMDNFILNFTANTTNIYLQPFPTQPYTDDTFPAVLPGLLSFFTLGYYWLVKTLINVLVEEKELRIKEGMKMMGLSNTVSVVSWFLTYFIFFAIISFGVMLVTMDLYQHSNKFFIFILFQLFGCAIFCYGFLVSCIFSTARVASSFGSIVFMLVYAIYYAVGSHAASKLAASLVCNVAFTQGILLLNSLETSYGGAQWDTISVVVDNITFNQILLMLFIDCIWYLLLGLYLQEVIPSQFGVQKPWYFVCDPRFWRSKKSSLDEGFNLLPMDFGTKPIEPVGAKLSGQEKIRIHGLTKTFPVPGQVEPFVAVKDLSLNLYEGQILALLGHNGAGKTTTINLLTGLYGPTSGDATIYGHPISTQMDTVRQMLGVCPQHNILFPLLTVREHLILFAGLKGVPQHHVQSEVEEMINEVDLKDKEHAQSKSLSGGQMRKLSVAIALIGGSKVVFFDEPTSGMDPHARRFTCDLLRKMRDGRVIILTTHSMEEADSLGDRIAIMGKGELRCCGSSLFLKSRYGVGYTLTFVKKPTCDSQTVIELTQAAIPNVTVVSEAGGELCLRLPFEASHKFANFFDDLDKRKEELKIESYGISVTTLEEVFLRVASEDGIAEKKFKAEQDSKDEKVNDHTIFHIQKGQGKDTHHLDIKDTHAKDDSFDQRDNVGLLDAAQKLTGFKLFWTQYKALVKKRIQWARRDRKSLFWQTYGPLAFMIVGGIFSSTGKSTQAADGVLMDTSPFNTPLYIPFNENNTFGSAYINLLQTKEGTAYPVSIGDSGNVSLMQSLLADPNVWSFTDKYRYGAYVFNSTTFTSPSFTLYHNTSAGNGLPIFYNLASNLMLRQLTSNPTASIKIYNNPLPSDEISVTQAVFSILSAVYIAIAFAEIPASFAAFVVKERMSKAKHQQLVSGVHLVAYWNSTWTFDLLNYLAAALLASVLLFVFKVNSLIGSNFIVTLVLMILYALSICPFLYLFSFLFNNDRWAHGMSALLNLIGVLFGLAYYFLSGNSSTSAAANGLRWVFRFLPSYCFADSIIGMCLHDAYGIPRTTWDMDVVGWNLLFMFLLMIIYYTGVLFVEHVQTHPNHNPCHLICSRTHLTQVPDPVEDLDEDVVAEKRRVTEGTHDHDEIVVEGLRKVFYTNPPVVAVKKLYFGIPRSQCFGYLGTNGAGKTTSLRMLTGDEIPTEGTAKLGGFDILSQQQEIRRIIGYCPQFDALLENLTAKEHLELYARVKGINERYIPKIVTLMLQQLGLDEYADKLSGTFSGGTKRKLSVGIALIGDPSIVFLDEPSTGLDPKSRRFMWNLIASTMKNRSVILTTHSMEEAEALCQRIAIIVGGGLRCIGSVQHLKSRYGSGWQVNIKISEGKNDEKSAKTIEIVSTEGDNTERKKIPSTIHEFMNTCFHGAQLIEDQHTNFTYRIQREGFTLGKVFRLLEEHRHDLRMEAYSVSETSLEQIFLQFAKEQEERNTKRASVS